MKEKRKYIFSTILILIIAVCTFMGLTFIPIKTNIRKTLRGIERDSQKNAYKDIELKIDGVYYNYILELFDKCDYYKGTLELSDMEGTQEPAFAQIFMHRLPSTSSDTRNGSGYYFSGSDSFSTGYITQKKLFSQVLIDLSGEEERYYVFPAESIEEAELIREKLEAWKYMSVE